MPVRVCPRCRSRFEADVAFCPRDGTSLRVDARADRLVGQTVAERYRIEARLGDGGMGCVYLAEHLMLRRKCALKVIHEGYADNADAIARFNREAANASRIMHPNVAAVFDFGETEDGMLFLAMEYVAGESLGALLARVHRLDARRATSIAWQVADALTAAHDLDIVHRDLKPENVLLSRHRDGSDLAKVVDFGVARVMGVDSQKVTSTGMVVGTQAYMSPEQLAGDTVDARSDLYSLGLVFFHMLGGRTPFEATTPQEALAARLRRPIRRLRDVCPEVAWPAALEDVLAIALSDDPAGRYQSVPEFISDLVAVVLEWRPDDAAAAEPWTQRLRYATPVRGRAVVHGTAGDNPGGNAGRARPPRP
jgi:serine/threonine-protein kinase